MVHHAGYPYIEIYFRVQEPYDEAVARNPCMVGHVPDNLNTQEMCDTAVAHSPCVLTHVPDNLKTQEMCDTAVRMNPGMTTVLDGILLHFPSVLLLLVPNHTKTQGICE